MKPYIVTFTYSFSAGRDMFASIIVESGNQEVAEMSAKALLKDTVGENCIISHCISFPFSISIPSPVTI